MKKTIVGAMALGAMSVAGTAVAADYTWQGATADWTASGNWHNGTKFVDWANMQNTIFPLGAPLSEVNVDKEVSPGQLIFNDDYLLYGSGAVLMNGNFHVADGKTCTMEAKLKQTTEDAAYRLVRGSAGTLVLKGGADLWRYQHDNGTTRVAGGVFRLTGASTGPGASDASVSFMRGSFIVEGGSSVTFDQNVTYLPNSGTAINITNGTFDASKVFEVLNGFGDNKGSYNSKSAYIRVADKGTFVAPRVRISKVSKTWFDANPEYGRIFIDKGGTMKVREWTMDDKPTFDGEIVFNGGLWEIITNTSEEASFSPFGAGTGTKWDGVRLTVGKGGAYIKNVGNTNRGLRRPFLSGDTNDGGVHILGSGLVYMYPTNTFNGGTYLEGSMTYIPRVDESLGAVPSAPKNNIFFKSSNSTLHFDYDTDVHPNRNVLISSNVTAKIGNGQTMRLKGTISTAGADPSASVLQVVNKWTGSLALAPPDGRTNVLGRVMVNGRLTIEDGTTLVTRNTGATVNSGAALYVQGRSSEGFETSRGVLEVTGGELKITKNVYCFLTDYAQLRVTGGLFDATAAKEILNAMNCPGIVEVRDTGVIETAVMRISQVPVSHAQARDANGLPTACVHVATGGVLRLTKFYIDNKNAQVGRLDLDGGVVACRLARTDFLGISGLKNWQNILVRSCAGGAIFDTTMGSVTVHTPILSGADRDGGLWKRGGNTLTLNSTNTYNGVTRSDGGTLTFADVDGFPGGDLGVSVLCDRDNARLSPLIYSANLAFRAGAKVRVYDTEEFTGDFGKKIILARSDKAMANPPSEVVVVDRNGNEKDSGEWRVMLSADRKTLYFGVSRGLSVYVR